MNEDGLIAQLKVLDPKFASNNHVFPPILSHLVSRFPNLVKPEEVDELDDRWRSYWLTSKELLLQISIESILQYWYNLHSIKDGLKNPKSPLLSQCVMNLTCSVHLSACVEQIFSQVNIIKNKTTNLLKAINNELEKIILIVLNGNQARHWFKMWKMEELMLFMLTA